MDEMQKLRYSIEDEDIICKPKEKGIWTVEGLPLPPRAGGRGKYYLYKRQMLKAPLFEITLVTEGLITSRRDLGVAVTAEAALQLAYIKVRNEAELHRNHSLKDLQHAIVCCLKAGISIGEIDDTVESTVSELTE